MNKNGIILVMLMVMGQSITAQTYYYRYMKSIIKGLTNTNVNGGQFITFDGKKCFESDKFGNNVGNGSMAYDGEVSKSTRLETYWGACYWSKNAYMKFNADKSLMNIETNAGKIYVYKRSTPPPGVTTCSLIRDPEDTSDENSEDGGHTPVSPTQPIYPQGGSVPTQQNSGGSQTAKSQREKRERVRRKCSTCNGKGTYERNDNGSGFGQTKYRKRCNVCGYEYWNSTHHWHAPCPTCHGHGYVEYWL